MQKSGFEIGELRRDFDSLYGKAVVHEYQYTGPHWIETRRAEKIERDFFSQLQRAMAHSGIKLCLDPPSKKCMGFAKAKKKEVHICGTNCLAETIATVLHEITHVLIPCDVNRYWSDPMEYRVREAEADSVAHIVRNRSGLPVGDEHEAFLYRICEVDEYDILNQCEHNVVEVSSFLLRHLFS